MMKLHFPMQLQYRRNVGVEKVVRAIWFVHPHGFSGTIWLVYRLIYYSGYAGTIYNYPQNPGAIGSSSSTQCIRKGAQNYNSTEFIKPSSAEFGKWSKLFLIS